ncbi:NAD(P)-dependent oxidoreductase [uncultured Microbacterium sp.]|uniref:NAD(P)-dependent oxidoreductase n=1 Tax=uncultured Microbacterium sp. TaxID=191216 RepID=UPI00261D818B|nr:NAD(P)H-binding protein [uncultured Microbacterium sp.]
MSRIAVIGGTGYAGSHIVNEAVSRGHSVVSVARSVPADRVEGAVYVEGTILDVPTLLTQIGEADVVVAALSPRGVMAGQVRPAISELRAAMPENVRLAVVGGAGGSLVAEGGPRLVDTDFPEDYKAEALEMAGVLEDLQTDAGGADWFLIHPAGGFGAWNVGERTGEYRDGGKVLVTDAAGESFISGPDLAVAVVDEIENPKHSRDNFAVGY